MRVFLSWSGEASRSVAEALREWLPNVLQAIDPWMSSEDLEKGAFWSTEMAGQLQETKAGIVCLTADNLRAPWIHYEAGALSKTIERALVCPYLFRIKPADVYGPLVQFQAAESNKKDTDRLIRTLNRALGPHALSEKQLERTYVRWWPDLETKLQAIPDDDVRQERTDRELLEEMLMLLRGLGRGTFFTHPASSPPSSGTPDNPDLSEVGVKKGPRFKITSSSSPREGLEAAVRNLSPSALRESLMRQLRIRE